MRQPASAATDAPTARAPSGARLVAEGVIDALEMGRLAPGQRLVEADLCLQYGVSRSSTREALQRLASDGVVDLSRHKGARVRELTLGDAIQTLELTELLTGLAARGAAARIRQPGAAGEIRNALDRLNLAAATADDRAFVEARRAFYAALLWIGGNRELERIFPTVQVHVLRAQFHLTALQRRLIADYCAIGEAVLGGDSVAAEEAAKTHVRRLRATLATSNDAEQGRHGGG